VEESSRNICMLSIVRSFSIGSKSFIQKADLHVVKIRSRTPRIQSRIANHCTATSAESVSGRIEDASQ